MNKEHSIARDAARHLTRLERLHGLVLVDGASVFILQDPPEDFGDVFALLDVLRAERVTPTQLFDVIGGRALFRVSAGFLARCAYAASKLSRTSIIERLCADGHRALRRWRGRDLAELLERSRARIDDLGALLRGERSSPRARWLDCRDAPIPSLQLDAALSSWGAHDRRQLVRVITRATALLGAPFSGSVLEHIAGMARCVAELAEKVAAIFERADELATSIALHDDPELTTLDLPDELLVRAPRRQMPGTEHLLAYTVDLLELHASTLSPRNISLERFASLDLHDAVARLRAEVWTRLEGKSELEFPLYMLACLLRARGLSLPEGAWLDDSHYRMIWYALDDMPRALVVRYWDCFVRAARVDGAVSRRREALYAVARIVSHRPPSDLIGRVLDTKRWRGWLLAPDWRALRAYLDVAERIRDAAMIDVDVDDDGFVTLFERSPTRADRIVLAVCSEAEVEDPASLVAVYLDLIEHVPALQPLLGPFIQEWERVPALSAEAWPRGYAALLELGASAEVLDAYLHYRELSGEPREFSRSLIELCEEGGEDATQRQWLREQLASASVDDARLAAFRRKLAALEDPERALGREAARARRALNLTERALAGYRARSLARGFERVTRKMLERLLGEAPPRELPEGVFASFSLLASSDTDPVLFERFLRDAIAGETFARWPANKAWIDERRARFEVDIWLRGFVDVVDVEGVGELTIATSRDPFDGLRMGTYFSTCLSLEDGFNRAAALTNVVEANKHVVFVRDSRRRVIGRKLIGVVDDVGLVGFRTYCNLSDALAASVRAHVDAAISDFATRVGLELRRHGSPKTLHQDMFWYDDGTTRWDVSHAEIDPPCWWPEGRESLFRRWDARGVEELVYAIDEEGAHQRELRGRVAAARLPCADVWAPWSSDFARAGKAALWGLSPEIAVDVRALASHPRVDEARELILLSHCSEIPRGIFERTVRAGLASGAGGSTTLNIDSMLADGRFVDALAAVEQLATLYGRDTCYPGYCSACLSRWGACADALLILYARKPEPRVLAASLASATGELLAILLRVAHEITNARVARALRGHANKIDKEHLRVLLLEGLARQSDDASADIVVEHLEENPGDVWLAGLLAFHRPELVPDLQRIVEYDIEDMRERSVLSALAVLDPDGVRKRLRRALSRARERDELELGELVREILDRACWQDFGFEQLTPSLTTEVPGLRASSGFRRGDDDSDRRRAGGRWLRDRATLFGAMSSVADRALPVVERHEAFERVMLAGSESLSARATFLISDPEVFVDARVCARWTDLADMQDVYFDAEAVKFRVWVLWYEWERRFTDSSSVSTRLAEEAGRSSTLYAALLMRSFTKGARALTARQIVFDAATQWSDAEFMVVSDACHIFPERVRGGGVVVIEALARALRSYKKNRAVPWLGVESREGYGPAHPVSAMLFVDALRRADAGLFEELLVELESRREWLSSWVARWRDRWPSLWGEEHILAVLSRYEELD